MSIHAMSAKMSTSTQFGFMAKKEEKTVRVQILMPETLRNQFKGEGIQAFHWRVDYVKFCEVLGLEADEYADQKYRAFQELVERLNEFDAETLAKMIESGKTR
jgi:hypothetical protein